MSLQVTESITFLHKHLLSNTRENIVVWFKKLLRSQLEQVKKCIFRSLCYSKYIL